ncbi:MAG: hypothetical protein ABI067_12590 [Leifsonia sp.]
MSDNYDVYFEMKTDLIKSALVHFGALGLGTLQEAMNVAAHGRNFGFFSKEINSVTKLEEYTEYPPKSIFQVTIFEGEDGEGSTPYGAYIKGDHVITIRTT